MHLVDFILKECTCYLFALCAAKLLQVHGCCEQNTLYLWVLQVQYKQNSHLKTKWIDRKNLKYRYSDQMFDKILGKVRQVRLFKKISLQMQCIQIHLDVATANIQTWLFCNANYSKDAQVRAHYYLYEPQMGIKVSACYSHSLEA